MSVKTVPVTMPAWLWFRLAKRAEARDIPVAGLIADLIRCEVDAHPRTQVPRTGSRLEVLVSEVEAARESGWRAPKHEQRRKGK